MTFDKRAYVAGFFDGEGNIHIRGRFMKTKSCWSLHLHLSNTNREVIETIRDWIGGGTISLTRRRPPYRIEYRLRWIGKPAVDVLEIIYPYLLVKKKQADIAFQFAKTFEHDFYDNRCVQDGGRRLKAATIAERVRLKEAITREIKSPYFEDRPECLIS